MGCRNHTQKEDLWDPTTLTFQGPASSLLATRANIQCVQVPLHLLPGGCGGISRVDLSPPLLSPVAQTSQPTRLPERRPAPPRSRLSPLSQSFSGRVRSHHFNQSPLTGILPELTRARRCARPQTTERGVAAGAPAERRARGPTGNGGGRGAGGRRRAPGMRVSRR